MSLYILHMQSEIEILKYYLWYPSPKIEILRNKFDPKIWITYRQQKKNYKNVTEKL